MGLLDFFGIGGGQDNSQYNQYFQYQNPAKLNLDFASQIAALQNQQQTNPYATSQAALVGDLTNQANGTGPSLASNVLQQSQANNLAQALSAAASARGNQNVGMAQRNATSLAANANQAGAATAANSEIASRLGAMSQLSNANQAGTNMNLGWQNAIQNLMNAGLGVNNAATNASTAFGNNQMSANAAGQANALGLLTGSASAIGKGVSMPSFGGGGSAGPSASDMSGAAYSADNTNAAAQDYMGSGGGAATGATADFGGAFAKGGKIPPPKGYSLGGSIMSFLPMLLNQGGPVNADAVSKGFKGSTGSQGTSEAWNNFVSAIQSLSGSGGNPPTQTSASSPQNKADGGKVAGRARVQGDSPKNDTVVTMTSPGEIVIPRSIAHDPEAARDFVAAINKHTSKQASSSRTPSSYGDVLTAFAHFHNKLKELEHCYGGPVSR